MDVYTQDFLIEVLKASAALQVDLIRLEAMPDDLELIGRIFRTLHNIKGTSGFLGLPNLGRLSHATESVVAQLRDHSLQLTPYIVETLLQCAGAIKDIVENIDVDDEGAQANDALLRALESLSRSPPTGKRLSGNRFSLPSLLNCTTELPSKRPKASARMHCQAIAAIWSILPEITGELARKQGKKINLVMEGSGTTLDRQTLAMLRAPLVHMVRNAVDHGIEMPEVRLASGKVETGRIRLRAFHDGGYAMIEIEDDGRGLDHKKIRRRIIENGLADKSELAALTDAAVSRFILQPGISTATEVTEISGRGVGLDVVRTNIDSIGGTIGIVSKPNRGTSFVIRIPLKDPALRRN